MLARILIPAAALSIALTGIAHTQPLPPLPELKFAEIGARENYLGDRWSFGDAQGGFDEKRVRRQLYGLCM